jgi:hypothetical protein
MVSALGPIKVMPIGGAGVYEVGVFRQETVTGVNRIGAEFLGDADNLGDRQISGHGAKTFANFIGLIGLEAVQRKLVFLGINRDCPFPHFVRRTHDANCNFTTVGHQDFLETAHSAKLLVSEGLKNFAPQSRKRARSEHSKCC